MTEPDRTPPAATVDSHHHFWDIDTYSYDWMPPAPNVLRRSYFPEDMAPLLAQAGISSTVLVEAHSSLSEADFLLDLAEASDFVAGVVAWVDLKDPEVGAVLERLKRRPGLVGIRHGVEHDPDEAWLGRDDSVRGLRELARADLAYDLLLRPHHLKYVPPLADKVPELRMVVDHIAKPPIASGELEPWATDITAVASIPGVYCKVSGMMTEADHQQWTVEDLKPLRAHVVEQFGLDRLMFGSDWPVCLLASSYDRVVAAALDAIGPLSESEKASVMGGNATDFYRLAYP